MDDRLISICESVLKRNVRLVPCEKALVVTDFNYEEMGRAFHAAAVNLGADASLLVMKPRRTDGDEPPEVVGAALQAADVIVSVPTYTLTHGAATRTALDRGARLLSLSSLSPELITSRAFAMDPSEVIERTGKIVEAFNRGSRLESVAPGGTSLTMDIGGWSRIGDVDDGMCTQPGVTANIPAGEALISPVEGSVNGTAVIDCSISGGIGKVERVELEIRDGVIVGFDSSPAAQQLKRVLENAGENAFNIAEFAVGTNPYAEIVGNMLMDEKKLGTAHLGIGNSTNLGGKVYSRAHVDAVFSDVTVVVDGITLIENGVILDQNVEVIPPAPWRHRGNCRITWNGQPYAVKDGFVYKEYSDVSKRLRHTIVQKGPAGRLAATVLERLRQSPGGLELDAILREYGDGSIAAAAELEKALLVSVVAVQGEVSRRP